MNKFKSVSSQVDFPVLEEELVNVWHENVIVSQVKPNPGVK